MLTRAHRLRSRGDINRCYSSGKTRYGEFVLMRGRHNNQAVSRYAVVVSKKVAKSAVTRNRIRRRASEIIRQSQFLDTGLDIVIIAKTGLDQASPEAVKHDIIRTLTGLHQLLKS